MAYDLHAVHIHRYTRTCAHIASSQNIYHVSAPEPLLDYSSTPRRSWRVSGNPGLHGMPTLRSIRAGSRTAYLGSWVANSYAFFGKIVVAVTVVNRFPKINACHCTRSVLKPSSILSSEVLNPKYRSSIVHTEKLTCI